MKILLFSIAISFMLGNTICSSASLTEPCYSDRKVTEELLELPFTCMKIGEDFYLRSENGNKRYQVCNIDEHKITEGSSYVVSGQCYEMFPNERWPGTPFQITKITPQE